MEFFLCWKMLFCAKTETFQLIIGWEEFLSSKLEFLVKAKRETDTSHVRTAMVGNHVY